MGLTPILGAAPSGVARGQTVAIQGGTIITMAGPRIVNGTVLMRDGKIVAVGARIGVPVGARVIDARGRFVMPGIVDPITYFGVPPEYLNDDEPITPEMRILHNYVPWRLYTDRGGPVRITELLSGGVTTQYIGPGDASVIGGQGVVVKTAAGQGRRRRHPQRFAEQHPESCRAGVCRRRAVLHPVDRLNCPP